MMKLYVAEHHLIQEIFRVAAWLTVGALIGTFHFLTLRWNVRIFTVDRSFLRAFTVQLVRFAVILGALLVVTRSFGALPLLAAAVGIVAARTTVVRFGVQP